MTTLEDLIDVNYMEITKTCLSGEDCGDIKINSVVEGKFRISFVDEDEQNLTHINASLDGIKYLAEDMLNFVKLMETPINDETNENS